MPSFAMGKELAGLGGVLNRFVAAPAAGAALFNQGRTGSTLDKALRAIPSTKNNDAGRAAWNELQYIGGQLMQGRNPYAKPAIGRIPPSANGVSYRDAELRLAAGGGGGGGGNAGYTTSFSSPQGGYSPAAERAYQQEASRVAQITAQDPELQRYELARQKAVAAGAGSAAEQSAEDLGMQMWAKANPTLAAKVKQGQAGYGAIQGTLAGNAARAGQGFGMQEQLVPTPQGFPTSVPAFPEGTGYGTGFGIGQTLAQTPAISFGAPQQAPAASAAQSAFGQPSVLDTADFERLLQQLKK
jgi:hypothetical protein